GCDWGSLVAAAKSLFVGGSVASKVAATVAVVGATTAAATAPVVLEHHGHSAPPGKAKPARTPAAPIVHAVAPTPATLKPAAPVHARGRVLHRPTTPASSHVPPGQLKKAFVPVTPAATAPAAPKGAVHRAEQAAKHTAGKTATHGSAAEAATPPQAGKPKPKRHPPAKTHGPKLVRTPTAAAPAANPTQPTNGSGRGNSKGDG